MAKILYNDLKLIKVPRIVHEHWNIVSKRRYFDLNKKNHETRDGNRWMAPRNIRNSRRSFADSNPRSWPNLDNYYVMIDGIIDSLRRKRIYIMHYLWSCGTGCFKVTIIPRENFLHRTAPPPKKKINPPNHATRLKFQFVTTANTKLMNASRFWRGVLFFFFQDIKTLSQTNRDPGRIIRVSAREYWRIKNYKLYK